jgi:hypothetical protein
LKIVTKIFWFNFNFLFKSVELLFQLSFESSYENILI